MNLHSVAPVILTSLVLLSSSVSADESKVDCVSIFSPLVESEPFLKKELLDLQKTCQQESKHLTRYWSCVEQRQKQGDATFDRLILNAQTCNDVSVAQR